jgi:hypothetical protein
VEVAPVAAVVDGRSVSGVRARRFVRKLLGWSPPLRCPVPGWWRRRGAGIGDVRRAVRPGGGWLPRPARWPCWRGGHPRRPGRVERRRAGARESGWDRPGPALCRRPSAPTAAPDGGVFQPLQPPTSAASRRSQRDRRLWPPSNCRCHADRVSYTALIPPARNPTAQKYQFWRRRQQSCPPWRGRPYRRISHTYRGSVDHAVRSAGPVRAGRITPGRRPAMPLAGLLARNPPAAPARKLSRTYTASTRPGPSGSSSTWRHDPVP